MATMRLILIFVMTAVTVSCEAKSCETSRNCDDPTARSMCVQNVCTKDIPCNKNQDCYFYGGQDIQNGLPAPKCVYPNTATHGRYGLCQTSATSNKFADARSFENVFRFYKRK